MVAQYPLPYCEQSRIRLKIVGLVKVDLMYL